MSKQGNKSALLVMDVQKWNISERHNDLLPKIQEAVQAARHHHIPVIWVKVAFSPGYLELNSQNKFFSVISSESRMTTDDTETQLHHTLTPLDNEPVVTKYRVSAFSGSNLEVILRTHHIKILALCGISTSGVVLSTVREAADKDYQLEVLEDACFDSDEEVHRILMEKVFPRQTEVISVTDWRTNLQTNN